MLKMSNRNIVKRIQRKANSTSGHHTNIIDGIYIDLAPSCVCISVAVTAMVVVVVAAAAVFLVVVVVITHVNGLSNVYYLHLARTGRVVQHAQNELTIR